MAKVNYDPVKAHKYYMEHRKLKGRRKKRKVRSTRGFSQSQKEQFWYAREQLKAIKKARNEATKERINEKKKIIIEALDAVKKRWRDQISEMTKAKVAMLRESMKGMSKEEKAEFRERINGTISNIRAIASEIKKSITASFSAKKKSVRKKFSEQYKAERDKNTEKYESELDTAYATIRGKSW